MHFLRLGSIFVVVITSQIAICGTIPVSGCSRQMIDHLRSAFGDVQTTLEAVLSVEETAENPVIGPFAGNHPQSLQQTYFGDTDERQREHITTALSNMPQAMNAASFSCINETYDPWQQSARCDTHVALSQHERNIILLCPAFLRTLLLSDTSLPGEAVEEVNGGQEYLAAHVLIHELAHTSAASSSKRIVDWFLEAPLMGSCGKYAYRFSPVQELACMSPRHAVQNADNVAWYAISTALSLKGAVSNRIPKKECQRAKHRWNSLANPDRYMIAS